MKAKSKILRTNFIGYPVDSLTMDDIFFFTSEAIKSNTYHFIAVQNANKMYLSEKYPNMKDAISKASLILPENAINIGMRWLRKPLQQRNIGGLPVMEELLRYANEKFYSIYLLGTTKENIKILILKLSHTFPNINIKGYHHGYFSKQDELFIVEEIGRLQPNYLFVGMGSPKQEFFIANNFNKLKSNICLGVGGSFNVVAGLEKSAPRWTKYGLEWLHRSVHDPKKIIRYFKINSFFILQFIKYLIKSK